MTLRDWARIMLALALAGWVASAGAQESELQVKIQNIPDDLLLTNEETTIDVEGRASIFGGMKFLDLFLILDASNSLYRTDPDDYRLRAAIALVRAIPVRTDIRIGIVAFETDARLVSPLTADREVIVEKLESIGRGGGTNLHDGIRLALDDFEANARPEAARISLLFTDGKSDRREAIAAAERARDRGMVIVIRFCSSRMSQKMWQQQLQFLQSRYGRGRTLFCEFQGIFDFEQLFAGNRSFR